MSSVTIGMTSKGINSTSRVISGGVSLDCRLKEPCGLHDPVFIVKGLSKSYNNYNFCTWRGRYYWVNEIVFLTNDIQEVHCSLDPLATYKGAIDDTYAYVQYGDSANWNHYIDDIRISPELEAPEWEDAQVFDLCDGWNQTGVVVMRYMDCSTSGGVKVVSMTPSAWAGLLDELQNSITASMTVAELTTMFGGQGSWRDCILSAKWIPLNIASGGSSQLHLGGIPCNVNHYDYSNDMAPMYTYSKTISLNWSVFNDWPFAKTSRWTSCQLYTPLGYLDIPVDYLRNQQSLYYRFAVNCSTGEASIKVSDGSNGSGFCYGVLSGDLGIDIMGTVGTGYSNRTALGNIFKTGAEIGMAAFSLGASAGSSYVSAASSARSASKGTAAELNTIGEAAGNQAMRQTIGSGISGIASAVPTGVGHSGASGSVGGGAEKLWITSPMGQAMFTVRSFRPLLKSSYDDFCDMYGYPVNYYLQLSSVSGFCKCSGAFVRDIQGATPADISTINSYLNAGIVLEA